MPNARQTSLIASPSSSRATNRRRSSITEHSFPGIHASPGKGKGVTHVSGTICHLCLVSLTLGRLPHFEGDDLGFLPRFLPRTGIPCRKMGRCFPASLRIDLAAE